MAQKIIGLEIGSDSVKMAVVSSGEVLKTACSRMPDNMSHDGHIVSMDAMSDFLLQMRKSGGIPKGKCALVLPRQAVISSQLTVPEMSDSELKMNLPYEFKDYIGQDPSKYVYDYVVQSSTASGGGKAAQLEIFAAAVSKDIILSYYDMLKKAGLTLKIAIPAEMAWQNLALASTNEPEEMAVVDVGHTSTSVHIMKGGKFVMGRTVEIGGQLVDETIASDAKVDSHMARSYKESNLKNYQTADAVIDNYNAIAIEVMKILNFYAYNSQGSKLRDIYYCGGMCNIEALRRNIMKATNMTMHHISKILPSLEKDNEHALFCAVAVGAALQKE